MNLMDRIFDLLPLIILIAISSSTNKKKAEKKQARNQERNIAADKAEAMQPNRQINQEDVNPRTKKVTRGQSIFDQFREALEEGLRETEIKPRSYQKEEFIDRDLYLPKKYENLAYLENSLSYETEKVNTGKSKNKIRQGNMDQEDILRGIIFAEILSPPKSRRR